MAKFNADEGASSSSASSSQSRCSKDDLELRICRVMQLLTTGHSRHGIVHALTQAYNVSPSQVYRYIDVAKRRLMNDFPSLDEDLCQFNHQLSALFQVGLAEKNSSLIQIWSNSKQHVHAFLAKGTQYGQSKALDNSTINELFQRLPEVGSPSQPEE